MIDGATDDQVRGLLDRHKARMARYVRWENWPVGECPPAGGRVKSGEVAPLPVVRLGIDCWLFIPDEIWRRARSTFRLFAFAVTGITASSCRSLLPLRADARDRPVAHAFPARTSLPAGPVPGAARERHEIVDVLSGDEAGLLNYIRCRSRIVALCASIGAFEGCFGDAYNDDQACCHVSFLAGCFHSANIGFGQPVRR
jgi:hypothetical protein